MFGVYTPLPPDHVIVVAVPPIADVIDTVASLQLPAEDVEIFTVAAILKLKVISSNEASHGPTGSSVVNVNITDPSAMSAVLGVYVAFCKLASSKDPVPFVVQVDVLAEPPIEPASVITSLEHICTSGPADTLTIS